MKKIISLTILILLSPTLDAKTLEYGYINGKWLCGERVSTGRNTSEYFYKGCSSDNLWDILNRDDQKWKKDGIFHSNTYNEYKPSKNVFDKCGLKYDPKTSITYNYPKCVKTFKY